MSREVGGSEDAGLDTAADGPYDSFLREAARVTDGAGRDDAPLAAGARLGDGRFEIERTLGFGGMGVVYQARDRQRGQQVALKTLRLTTLEALHRLRGEFLVVHELVHRNLVSLGELHDDAGRWFFTMELVGGVDFLTHVRPAGQLDQARLRAALAQLVAGLGFLHGAGIVHRDVKPSNLLLDGDRVVILDFGLARDQGGAVDEAAGTVAYMAPEQAVGAANGPAADWYAVGVMLWEALTGRLPFEGPRAELLAAKRAGAPAIAAAGAVAADLAALAVALLDPDPRRRPDDAQIAAALGVAAPVGAAAAPFVGRAAELAALEDAWTAAAPGGAVALVRGPSGVGKSALLGAFTATRRGGGALVLEGRCHERVAVPYKGMHGVAEAIAAHLRGDPAALQVALADPEVALLPAIFPSLAEVPELARAARGAPSIRDPQQLRARVFDAFAGLLGRLAARAPLAMVIDDVQWADRDGLRLLEHVIAGERPGLLVIAVGRDGALGDDASWLASARAIEVAPLPAGDAEELARRLAGVSGDAGAIAREASGHPLHIAELVRHWQHRADATAPAPRLDDAIGQRAADLPADHARILALIALAGAPLAPSLIGDAASVPAPALWPALAALRAAHLVRTPGARADDAVEPYHDRVREAVVGRLVAAERIDGHARLAAAIERVPGADARAELLAYHLEAARQPSAAAIWAERAAEQASAALAFDRAAELYQRALALGAAEPVRQAALRSKIGDAFANAGRGGAAADAYLAAAAQVDADHALELRRRGAEQLLRSGRMDAGLVVIDGVLREVALPPLGQRRFPVAALLGERLRLGLSRLRAAPPRRPSAAQERELACCWAAVVGLSMVEPLRSVEYQARHLRLALAAGDARRIALGLAFEAVGAAGEGPPARRAHRLLAELERHAAGDESPQTRAYVAMAHGMVAFLTGQWRDALAASERAERIFRDECVGVAWEIATTEGVSLTCLWHTGRIAELRRRIGPVLADADRRGDLNAATHLRSVLQPNLRLMEDRVDAARAELDRAASGLPRRALTIQHWQHMQATALVELYAGDPRAALRLIDERTPALRGAFLFRVQAVRSFSSYVRAAAALGAAALGGPEAPRWRRIAVAERRALTGRGQPAAAPILVDAELAVLAGELDRAARLYRAAADGFATIDMTMLAASARWRLGELLGGDEGAALIAAASAKLRAEGIVRPDRLVAVFAPVACQAR